VLFKQAFLDGIQAGTITLAFRRWQRPTVKAGGTLLTAVGQLSIGDVRPVMLAEITGADARRAGWESLEALRKELRRGGRGGSGNSRGRGDKGADGGAGDGAADGAADGDADSGQIYRIELGALRADPRVALRAEGLDDKAADDLRGRLDRLDARAADGPWTRRTLEVIRDHPGVRAGDLCAKVKMEMQPFKVNVRKLKALGLTESLEIGYRLSARGRAWLARRG
jgi:hypothetical protein